jgi:GT2 family glycosyltransferase
VSVQHETTLTVSVIVPTFNRRDRLKRLLAGLEQHHAAGARFEVVVVVDGATDGTVEMLAALRMGYPLQVHHQPNQGPAAARNAAIAAATGEVLLFLDDDVVPAEGMISRHLRIHAYDRQAVVTGPMIDPPDRTLAPWLRWEAVMLRKQYDAMLAGEYAPTPRQFYTANASVRREHVLAAGGFDTRFTRAEDVELAYRLAHRGMRFYFEPAAAVLHEPDRTFESWLRVGYEYGRHDVLMARTGRTYVLAWAFEEFRGRHPLNRLAMRLCAGHPVRLRAFTAICRTALSYRGPGASFGIQRPLCSALFNAHYWQGVADATGRGAAIWKDVAGHTTPAPRRPWAGSPEST